MDRLVLKLHWYCSSQWGEMRSVFSSTHSLHVLHLYVRSSHWQSSQMTSSVNSGSAAKLKSSLWHEVARKVISAKTHLQKFHRQFAPSKKYQKVLWISRDPPILSGHHRFLYIISQKSLYTSRVLPGIVEALCRVHVRGGGNCKRNVVVWVLQGKKSRKSQGN